MQIKAVPRSDEWVVIAEWMGAQRVVFRGSIWACLRFRRDNEEAT